MQEPTYYIKGLFRQANAQYARDYLGITAVGSVSDVNITFTDNTTNNASTLKHGFLPKLSGNPLQFLNGLGAWAVPAGGSGTVTNTGTLTDHGVIVGNGGVDVSAIAVGTTNTVLHGNTGTDPSFSAVVEADITLADNTTNNVSTLRHGLTPKLDGNDSNYLDGTGAYSNPTGGMVVGWFRYDNNTTIADPGAGDFRMNAASFAGTTIIAFDQLSDPGNDVTAMIMLLRTNDQILIQKKNDATIYGRFTVGGTPTNHTGWFEVAVTNVVTSGTMPSNTQLCAIVCSYDGGGGGGSGTVTNTGTLTDHGVIVGNGGVDVSAISVGATNTVLHGNTGADPSFSAVVEADITLADNTTNDVSTTKHGFAPKSPNDSSKYLDGTGAYSIPTGTGVDPWYQWVEHSLIPTSQAATFQPLNVQNVATANAFTTVAVTANNFQGLNLATSTAIDNIASAGSSSSTGGQFLVGIQGEWIGYVRPVSSTNARLFLGITALTPTTQTAGDTPTGNYACFRYSTSAGDTNWKFVIGDNSSTETFDTGVAINTTTMARLEIRWDGTATTSFKAYIGGTLVATGTLNPAAATTFHFSVMLRVLANGTAKSFDFFGHKLRHRWPS